MCRLAAGWLRRHTRGSTSAAARCESGGLLDVSARKPGYWRRAGAYALCATFAGKDVIHVIARFPGTAETDWTWTAHWNPVTYPNGIQTTDAGLLNFPLREGQTYDAAWVDESFSIGMRSTHRRTVHVIGWEEVVVPAGKFRALRVEAEGDYIRKWGGIDRTDAGAARNVIWYVPEVRRWVKRLDAGSDVGGERSQILEELVTFSLQ